MAELAVGPEAAGPEPAGPEAAATASTAVDLEVLDEIQRRVLWLAVRMVDAANHERSTGDGVKVGGHQASSASLVTAMTALWFAYLSAEDRVSVKPHASPVFHAIQYLLGNLDRKYLTTLRARGGLQAYPSRTKDPDDVDFSTGSVGLGAVAPLFAAVARRYVDAHFGERPRSRFIALLGDAELDEGNVWEAVFDPVTHGLGNVMWVIDFNRQSLDRVVPGVRIAHWKGQFEAAGWHVVEVKYGRQLQAKFAGPACAALRAWINNMPNEHYQSLFGLSGEQLRERFTDGAPPGVDRALTDVSDEELVPLLTDLGGHDMASMLAAYAACDEVRDRPSVIFAYTVKGWGLPSCPRYWRPPLSSPTRASPRTSSTSRPWTVCTPRGSAPCGTASARRPPRRSPVRCARRSRKRRRWSPCTTPPRTRWPGSAQRSASRPCRSAWTSSASPAASLSCTSCTTCCPAPS